MKSIFSKTWKASKQPRKQRKYRHNAPIHVRRKFLSAHLSKHLRKEYGRRSAKLRTEDLVKILRGEFNGKEGKVQKIDLSKSFVFIEGITKKKSGGKEFQVPVHASNVQIVELNLKDAKRVKALKKQREPPAQKTEKPTKEVKETKEVKQKPESKK
ncbi:50S ribosomal protein L24 [uncultured archaeon]|nr:50S ribosomal protein L24 [uncultured archaeon]